MSVAAANTAQRVQCAAAPRPFARAARIAGRRHVRVVRSQQQEPAAAAATAAASFTRLEEALDDYRRAPPSVVRALWSLCLLAAWLTASV